MIRALIASFASLALAACATIPTAETDSEQPVTVRIVGINDFHGNLLPRKMSSSAGELSPGAGRYDVPVGGAAVLATAVSELRAQNEYSMVVSAGDLISASPLVSSYFLDEPAIGVMNRIGLDFNAVGNHEFDRGWHELLRMQNGGCEVNTMRTPCAVENPFTGAEFQFLSANVVRDDGGELFPGYGIKRFGSGADAVAVAVIGLSLKDVPLLVSPSGLEGLNFGDEADAINALVPKAIADGADAVIVAIHQGFDVDGYYRVGDSCAGNMGPLDSILKRLDPRVDVVISGHTHREYVCDYAQFDPSRHFLVTSAGYGSGMVTDIALTIDPKAGDVVAETAENVLVQSDDPAFRQFTPDPEIAAYVARYQAASKSAEERPAGKLLGEALKGDGIESPLGELIADAQLAATRGEGAQIAFMNDGGVRADLVPAADGTVTFGQIYAVQPFGNVLETFDMTGAQIKTVLEQQYAEPNDPNYLQVSEGFHYTLDLTAQPGSRVSGMTLDGEALDPAKTYRVTISNFLQGGGDRFAEFTKAKDPVIGATDLDAFEAYLDSEGGRAVPAQDRVTIIR
ncbi:bifunctional metallophosphatase/5'-nucleotidase [Croceicoccus mobilis]|uniref:Bifunctional metallophosphatase/5'-nucleotidase n=1 Tax=Croceicoccus mobilis TaxID=1703339 RepID=A0A916Z2H9_9SPHN|nr:bifunctional metallophosphatase/5'-nucleotidase [Croceicoccus mobilis]GGD71447.1 bifunctional metallophosphatase/5'-nucleotidase [Croceicoccus mobilis]